MRHRVHPETDQHISRPWRHRVVAGVATLSLASALFVVSPATHAQDGTSGAAPLEETNCVLVPASDINALRAAPSPASTPVASPVTDLTGAIPVVPASPAASPAANTAKPFNTELLLEDLTAASTSLTSCLSEGNTAQVVSHTSELFRAQLLGSPTPLGGNVFASLYDTLPPVKYQVLEIQDVQLVDDTTATAQVVWQLAHQVRVDQWTFSLEQVQGLPVWTVQRAEPGSVEPKIDATTIEVTISDNRYELGSDTVSREAAMFDVTNQDDIDHELLVLRLGDGISTDTLLRTPGPELPEGVTMIGQATIAANSDGRLLLNDLEPGTYTIVCLLPNENGVPHLSEGMEATFTVE